MKPFMKIKKSNSIILSFLLDYLIEKKKPRQKAPIFQLSCSILVAFGVEIHDFFSFCPYFDSKFGQLFTYLPYMYINNMNNRDGISVNRYIGLADISTIFQISDIGIGWHSTDINIGYRISANDKISDIG